MMKWLRKLGPGWITGASDDDPSGIGTYSYSGSRFGFQQSWMMVLTLPLMIIVQEMCARIAQVTGKGLAAAIRKHHHPAALHTCVLLLFFANTINIAANIGAMAAAMQLVIDIPFIIWALLLTAVTLILEIFISYQLYARYLKILTLSLFGYVATAFIVQIDWGHVAGSIAFPYFSFEREYLFGLAAILGTTIAPYLFFWQASSEIETEIVSGRTTLKQRRVTTFPDIAAMRFDVISGMIFSNAIAFFILLTAAATLFSDGIVIETAQDAAKALVPIAGPFAALLFALGIVGTGLLSIPILAGSASYAIAESYGWKSGLSKKLKDAHGFYGVISIATLVGLCINFIGIDPIKLLLWTAVINGAVAPVILTFIIRIGNNKAVMGRWKNGAVTNFFSWATVVLMSASAVLLLVSWLIESNMFAGIV